MQKPNIAVGSKVRSYDFPGSNHPPCYIEGTVLNIIEDGERAEISVEKEVWNGQVVVPSENSSLTGRVVCASLLPHWITEVYGVVLVSEYENA